MDKNQTKFDYENIQYSVRAPRYAVTQFKEMATAFSSPGACFERMVTERLEGLKPQMEAANKQTEELQQRIRDLESQSSEKDDRFENHKEIIRNQQQEIADLKQQLDEARKQPFRKARTALYHIARQRIYNRIRPSYKFVGESRGIRHGRAGGGTKRKHRTNNRAASPFHIEKKR